MPESVFCTIVHHGIDVSECIEKLNGTSHAPLVQFLYKFFIRCSHYPAIKCSPYFIIEYQLGFSSAGCIINQFTVSIVATACISWFKRVIAIKTFVVQAPMTHIVFIFPLNLRDRIHEAVRLCNRYRSIYLIFIVICAFCQREFL